MKRTATARKTIKRVMWGAVCAVVLWTACLAWQIASYARRHDPAPADVAIVLGAAVWGTEPSPVFAARIDHAIALYRGGRGPRILFTGGVGTGERDAEAAQVVCCRPEIPRVR